MMRNCGMNSFRIYRAACGRVRRGIRDGRSIPVAVRTKVGVIPRKWGSQFALKPRGWEQRIRHGAPLTRCSTYWQQKSDMCPRISRVAQSPLGSLLLADHRRANHTVRKGDACPFVRLSVSLSVPKTW